MYLRHLIELSRNKVFASEMLGYLGHLTFFEEVAASFWPSFAPALTDEVFRKDLRQKRLFIKAPTHISSLSRIRLGFKGWHFRNSKMPPRTCFQHVYCAEQLPDPRLSEPLGLREGLLDSLCSPHDTGGRSVACKLGSGHSNAQQPCFRSSASTMGTNVAKSAHTPCPPTPQAPVQVHEEPAAGSPISSQVDALLFDAEAPWGRREESSSQSGGGGRPG